MSLRATGLKIMWDPAELPRDWNRVSRLLKISCAVTRYRPLNTASQIQRRGAGSAAQWKVWRARFAGSG